MAVALRILLQNFFLTLAVTQCQSQSHAHFPLEQKDMYDGNQRNSENNIIWNGCESVVAMTKYDFPTVEKPKICSTGLPQFLENVKPQKSKPPFLIKILSSGIGGLKSLLITVAAKHNKNDGKLKSHKMKQRNTFQSLYIFAKSLDGSPVGSFYVDEVGARQQFAIGYCCGESRDSPNLYELNVEEGEWTTDVSWDPLGFSGFVNFK